VNDDMLAQMSTGHGFIAALDQSGGSTPKALHLYGIEESAWTGESGPDEAAMFDLVHQMRTRIITSPVFDGTRVLAAILFEQTMDRRIDGLGSAEYLWTRKHVVPFLKVDKGLADEADGARVMKPIPDLDALLERALGHGVFGTKMRSVLLAADRAGVDAVVSQQFEVAGRILATGLVPIIEPEVDIHSPQKADAEKLLHAGITAHLDALPADRHVMLKLTLPSVDDFYADLVAHPRVLRVVALSGGYSRAEADAILARQHGVVASFSRALAEGLHADQTAAQFHAILDASIAEIYAASAT
jgi:fructose-bisphosphate aldolase class I